MKDLFEKPECDSYCRQVFLHLLKTFTCIDLRIEIVARKCRRKDVDNFLCKSSKRYQGGCLSNAQIIYGKRIRHFQNLAEITNSITDVRFGKKWELRENRINTFFHSDNKNFGVMQSPCLSATKGNFFKNWGYKYCRKYRQYRSYCLYPTCPVRARHADIHEFREIKEAIFRIGHGACKYGRRLSKNSL